MKIYDNIGKEVWSSGHRSWDSSTKKNIINEDIDLTKGDYRLKVERYYSYTGPYTFSIGTVNSVTPQPTTENPFADVKRNDWYYSYVAYVNANNLMTGLNDTTFGPGQFLARAQFAVILHRMSGMPKVAYTAKFPDVPDKMWFTNAILWANRIEVVTGYTNTGLFGTADNINREQMAVMMYRYAKYMNYNTSQKTNFSKFSDASKVSGFAREAMQWAVGTGIITGKNNGTRLDPQGNASRAECATIIMRFVEKYQK